MDLADVEMVKEFDDVFFDEFSSLAPPHEVEFHIDLIPGMTPIGKVPYISVSSIRDEGDVESASRIIRAGFYQTELLTLGSVGSLFEEEGWFYADVHRL